MASDLTTVALYRISELERQIKVQADEIAQIERRNEERDAARVAMERKQLLWGITFLGGVIMTLGTVIWSYRSVIFKGAA